MSDETNKQVTAFTFGQTINIEEQKRDFTQRHPFDNKFWDKMSDLTIVQAALYTLGIEPAAIQADFNTYEEPVSTDELPHGFLDRITIIKSAVRADVIERVDTSSNNHSEVVDETRIAKDSFLKWCAKQSYDCPKGIRGGSPSTRERETLLKMIIGMAVDGYAYDPKDSKSKFTGEGADSLHTILNSRGISISADTIRKYLAEATEFIPANK